MARKKTTVPETNLTESQIEKHLEEYSLAEARCKGLKAKMEEQLTKVREKFAEKINAEEAIMQEHNDKLYAHALTHKAEFEKKRTRVMKHGSFGFNLGKPALKTAKGFTWAAVLELIEAHEREDLIRIKKEVAKDKIIANREELANDGTFDKIKVQVHQKETFFVESKAEKEST